LVDFEEAGLREPKGRAVVTGKLERIGATTEFTGAGAPVLATAGGSTGAGAVPAGAIMGPELVAPIEAGLAGESAAGDCLVVDVESVGLSRTAKKIPTAAATANTLATTKMNGER
jgi:hypothetical protein